MNKITLSVISVVLVAVIGGGAYFLFSGTDNDPNVLQDVLLESPQPESEPLESEPSIVQDPQETDLTRAVATVNGEEISLGAFEMQMFQMSQNPQMQGAAQEELQSLVLDQLISHRLLVQAARDQDITIADEVIEAELDQVRNQFESQEMMEAQLELLGMDEAALHTEIEDQAILNEYYSRIAHENDLEVSDEEIEQFYAEHVAIQEGAPSLEEVAPLISDQLERERIQPYLSAIVEEYLEAADIEILM